MAAITKITLNGQNHHSFGDDCSEAAACGYRKWIAAQLAAAFLVLISK